MLDITKAQTALASARADATDYVEQMKAAASAAAVTARTVMALDPSGVDSSWTTIRGVSQLLVSLSGDYVSISADLKNFQTVSVSWLGQTLDLESAVGESGLTQYLEAIREKIRISQTHLTNLPWIIEDEENSFDLHKVEKEKFDALCEQETILAGWEDVLTLMKEALEKCEEAIADTNRIFVHRVRNNKANFFKITDTADMASIKHIISMGEKFKGLSFRFALGSSLKCSSTVQFCDLVLKRMSKGMILKFKSGTLYNLSIGQNGKGSLAEGMQLLLGSNSSLCRRRLCLCAWYILWYGYAHGIFFGRLSVSCEYLIGIFFGRLSSVM